MHSDFDPVKQNENPTFDKEKEGKQKLESKFSVSELSESGRDFTCLVI